MGSQTVISPFAAAVLHRLLAGMTVNGHLSSLPNPWLIVGENIQAAPTPGEKLQAFDTAIAGMPDPPAIKQAVLSADPAADLDALKAAAAQQSKPRFVVRNARYALQPQPPIDWIVDKLFSAGLVSLVYGAPGSKKTYSMLSCAVSVALGKPWLGLATRQTKALIVDEESGDLHMARRLAEVLRGELGDENTPVEFVSLAGFDLRSKGDGLLLQDLIEKQQAGFVIIDALADIMPGADENLVRDVQPIFLTLRRIAADTKAAIVLIHHANKIGGYRGSTSIPGAVDLLLEIKSQDGSDDVSFETVKCRHIRSFKFAGKAHFSGGNVWFDACTLPQQGARLSPSESFVIEYLKAHGQSAAISDIEAAADVCSADAARKAVYKLAGKKIIFRANSGGQGAKAFYTLIDPGIINQPFGVIP